MVSLIDTDVMVDVSRANASAASYLDSLIDPAISIITAQELIVGARDKRDLLVSTPSYRRIPLSTLTPPSASLHTISSSVTRNRMACAPSIH